MTKGVIFTISCSITLTSFVGCKNKEPSDRLAPAAAPVAKTVGFHLEVIVEGLSAIIHKDHGTGTTTLSALLPDAQYATSPAPRGKEFPPGLLAPELVAPAVLLTNYPSHEAALWFENTEKLESNNQWKKIDTRQLRQMQVEIKTGTTDFPTANVKLDLLADWTKFKGIWDGVKDESKWLYVNGDLLGNTPPADLLSARVLFEGGDNATAQVVCDDDQPNCENGIHYGVVKATAPGCKFTSDATRERLADRTTITRDVTTDSMSLVLKLLNNLGGNGETWKLRPIDASKKMQIIIVNSVGSWNNSPDITDCHLHDTHPKAFLWYYNLAPPEIKENRAHHFYPCETCGFGDAKCPQMSLGAP